MFAYVLLLSMVVSTTWATLGVDVSQAVSETDFHCLKSNGFSFAIVRVYEEVGRVDPNGAQTIKNAHDAGIEYVDGYIFPCHSCGNPGAQVSATVSHLHAQGAKFGMLWFDIEGAWSGTAAAHNEFIRGMISEANALGVRWGIYTSESQWGPITGNTAQFGAPALWYAHYDDRASFSDFVPFGGWHRPSIKQYVGNALVCGVGIDKNFY